MRSSAAVLVGVLLAAGLVRGATTELGSLRNEAKKALERAAGAENLRVGTDDETTPKVALAAIVDMTPGSDAKISASGSFGPATKFTVAGRGFSLTTQNVGTNTFSGTVHAASDVLPGAALLRATNRRGTGEAVAAYVAGSWRIEGTTDNGWRVRLSPASSTKQGVLAFKGEFFEGTATTAFTTRDATVRLEPQLELPARYRMDFASLDTSGFGDPECDPIMKRARELASRLMAAKTQAEEDLVSAEVDKIQDQIDTCIERQQANAEKMAAKYAEVAKKAELEAKKFGCSGLEFTATATGEVQGSFSCTTGAPTLKGTMRRVGN